MENLKDAWLLLMARIKQNGVLIKEDDPYLELLDQSLEFSSDNAFDLLKDSRINTDFQEMKKVFFTRHDNAFGHSYLDCILTPTTEKRFFTQSIVGLLKKKPFSRKAILTFAPYGDRMVPCVNCVHFLRRKDRLHLSYFARGQDIYRKFPCDTICLIQMGQIVAKHLNLPLGTVTANISSAHIYVNDLPKIENYLNGGEVPIPRMILTSNTKKYHPLQNLLKKLDLELLQKDLRLSEIQSAAPRVVIEHKARCAYESLGQPIWVDDSFLLTEAYPNFPGPLTKYVFKTLGVQGLANLLKDKSKNASMLCLMAYFDGTNTHIIQGQAPGVLDFTREIHDEEMPLNSIFLTSAPLQHRINALENLANYRYKTL